MARYLIFALLIVALVCVMQASAYPAQETSTESIGDALKSAGDSISKAFQDAKPKLEEWLAKGQEFVDSVGKKISEEAGKIIPKSDEKAAA